jgi:hypothetical protein
MILIEPGRDLLIGVEPVTAPLMVEHTSAASASTSSYAWSPVTTRYCGYAENSWRCTRTSWPQLLVGEGIPSRRLRRAGPRPPGPGGAPHRTYDLDHGGRGLVAPPVRGGRSVAGILERPVQGGSPDRRRPGPGGRAGGPPEAWSWEVCRRTCCSLHRLARRQTAVHPARRPPPQAHRAVTRPYVAKTATDRPGSYLDKSIVNPYCADTGI